MKNWRRTLISASCITALGNRGAFEMNFDVVGDLVRSVITNRRCGGEGRTQTRPSRSVSRTHSSSEQSVGIDFGLHVRSGTEFTGSLWEWIALNLGINLKYRQ